MNNINKNFLNKIFKNLVNVSKNKNTEIITEFDETCKISITDTITLNFNSENFQYYISNIIKFYKNYKERLFNEIIIKDDTNEIKYNFDVNVLLVHNKSFDKIQKKTEFIVKLIENVKKLNIEIRNFDYVSNNFKFEFSGRSAVYVYVKNNSSEKIIIKDKNIVSFSASYDIQDTVLLMFCELKDFIDIKPILKKYVSENKSKIIENKKLLLDIISWYVILGGNIEEDPYINFEGIVINSFKNSENITYYRSSQNYVSSEIKNKLYYSFEENSVTYKEKDVYQFYTPNEIIKDFEKNNNITFNKIENIEKFCKKFIKNDVIFNYRKIFKTLSEMKKLSNKKEVSLILYSPFFPSINDYVLISENDVMIYKGSEGRVYDRELNELHYISDVTGYNICINHNRNYYEITEENI